MRRKGSNGVSSDCCGDMNRMVYLLVREEDSAGWCCTGGNCI